MTRTTRRLAFAVGLALAPGCAEGPPARAPGGRPLAWERIGAGLPDRGQWREGFDVADVDGDGALDVVHGPPRGGRAPHVFLGDGAGGFRPWDAATFPDLPYDYGDARAADLDADGVTDLVLAVHGRGLVALRGDGRGGFTRAGEGLDFDAGGAAFSSKAVRVLDVDGDGRADVLALGEGPRLARAAPAGAATARGDARGIALHRGRGDGSFDRDDGDREPSGLFGADLAVGDFDGDGHVDFATASGQLGRRDLVHLVADGGRWRRVVVPGLPERAYVRAVAAADFDGDGRAALVAAWTGLVRGGWRTGIVVASIDGEAPGPTTLASADGRRGHHAVAAGDVDGDGALDVAAVDADGTLAIFRGDGRGGFAAAETAPPWDGPCRGAHVAIADLDGDGAGEIVAAFAEEPRSAGGVARCPRGGGLAAWRVRRASP